MLSRLKSLLAGGSATTADSVAEKTRGDEHLRHDRWTDAATCYRRALAANPDYVDALVGLGFTLGEQKQWAEAESPLRRAASLDPRNADVPYMLGNLAKEQGKVAAAIEHYERALALNPEFLFAYRGLVATLFDEGKADNLKAVLRRAIAAFPEAAEFQRYLGDACSAEGDLASAVASYRQALSMNPSSAATHKHLADVLQRQGHFDEAIANYRKAVWFDAAFADAHGALGLALRASGRLDDAVASLRRAVELQPESAGRHQDIGNALLARGETKEAIACYEQVRRLDPANPIQHLIAALTGAESEGAPSGYVERLFDEYAQNFDAHLVGTLSYNDPQKLADLLHAHYASGRTAWSVLDIGCGTGLSGAAIGPYAREIVGVDLSSKMLEKARERGLYKRLEQTDLLTMMRAEPTASYDVVFSTDVFIYVGKLEDVVEQTQRLLCPGGLFAFSVEALDALVECDPAAARPGDFRLNATGRYSHSMAYLRRLAAQNRFDVLSMVETQCRLDKGTPIMGYLALWRRT